MDTLDTFLDTSKVAKVAQLFVCNFCHYSTTKKSNYKKHLSSTDTFGYKNGYICYF